MYLAAPCNQYYEPGIKVSEGEAEIVIPVQKKFLDAAGSVHGSVFHRAMNDAALFAVNSVIPKQLVLSTDFNIQLTGSTAEGELVARGRVIGASEEHCLAEAVVLDSKRILPVAAYLEGEFGLSGIYLGVPAKVGAGGVEQVLEFELTDDEKVALEKSARTVRDLITDLDLS